MKTILTIAAFAAATALNAQIMIGDKTEVTFYSYTPVENISARTTSVTEAIDFGSGAFKFKIRIKTFDFPNDLMEEHFNENYMESDKYPEATFDGTFVPATAGTVVDITKDGVYPVFAKGDFTIHGVTQKRDIPAVITVKGGKVSLEASFKVKLVDHKIDVPSVVFTKIAEEIDVKVKSTLKR